MHKSATKCNETVGKWCINKHGASKIMDTLETYHLARTFFFLVKDQHSLCESFSEEGLQLWEKYFAPDIDSGLFGKNQDLQIPVSWFNFITLMLVTPERFDWTVHFLNSSLW
jgi:hypothetical protein